MKVIQYCPFCKTEHEVIYEGICCVQYLDGGSLSVYRCDKFNRIFRLKEYNELQKDVK